MVARRTLLIITGVALCSAVILVASLFVYEPAIPPIPRPDPGSFAASLVTEGAALVEIGDCAVCHTAERGAPYALSQVSGREGCAGAYLGESCARSRDRQQRPRGRSPNCDRHADRRQAADIIMVSTDGVAVFPVSNAMGDHRQR